MTPTKKTRDRSAQNPPTPSGPTGGRGRKSWYAAAGITVLLVAVAAIIGLMRSRSRAVVAFPPPAAGVDSISITRADFVGSAACAECHASQYKAWSASTHGRAGEAPPHERIIAPFEGVPLRFRDATVTPSRRGGQYFFSVAQRGRPTKEFRVDAVVGGGFMAGGGTQAYFSRLADGTLRFLPFDYSKTLGKWFCNTRAGTRAATPVSTETNLADCSEWPPRRTLGSSDRFPGCQQCHGSQIQLTFDAAAHKYDTRFTTLAINCESCHGPGKRHIELARAGSMHDRTDIGMRSLETLTKDQSLAVCFQCHAVKSQLQSGYLPGKPFAEHYALKLPQLIDTVYFPDGRTRTFAYQEGHLSSDCYLNGSMTCVDCHDPHTQRYRDVTGAAVPGRTENGQCLGCHPSKAEPLSRHTRHPANSPGSRCVACHMPYLQQPEVGPHVTYRRSDHTIAIPRPAFDTQLGIDNACLQCHRDRPVADLQAEVTAWYGRLKPLRTTVSAMLAADSLRDPAAIMKRVETAYPRDPMSEFGLGLQVFRRSDQPDAPQTDRYTVRWLEELARHPDIEVEALALASAHWLAGDRPSVRRFLTQHLRQLGSRDRAVRKRWSWILQSRGNDYLNGGDYGRAISAYQKANEVDPDDPLTLRGLGVAHARRGDYDRAVQLLRRSLERDPNQSQVLVDLGIALLQRGDPEGAVAAHRAAVAVSPWDPIGYANLGLILLRRGETQAALEPLEKAVDLDPGLADASFLLGSAYATLGRFDQASKVIERGLEFAPHNPRASQMLEEVRRRSGSVP